MKKALFILLLIISINAQAGQGIFENIVIRSINGAIVFIRQDYQLVDENEGEIKNAPEKEYWERNYYLAVRIGDDSFLISGETVRPWIKKSFSKNDRFQPALSSTAVRSLGGTEFEIIDFDTDALTELQANRLYIMSGSEEPGMSLIAREGHQRGFTFWVCAEHAPTEDSEIISATFEIIPMDCDFTEEKSIYDIPGKIPENAIGGFYIVPFITRPGLIDFSLAGMCQKISGVWRVVAPSSGTEIGLTANHAAGSAWLDSVMDGMEEGMENFLSGIGL